jgi:predicted glycosyltransferase
MKYLFYLGHPAHFHLFKNIIWQLQKDGHDTRIVIKKKDVLENLLQTHDLPYVNIMPRGRKDNRFSIAFGVVQRDAKLFNIVRRDRPDVMIGTSAEIAHVGRLLGIPSIVVNEDDYDVVPRFSRLAYPAADYILVPACCRVGKWRHKKIAYDGYHELAYLHPSRFTPDRGRLASLGLGDERFFLLRFAKLTAHHDAGIRGIDQGVAERIIRRLEPHGKVLISAERELEPQFEKYCIRIDPSDMHHALAFADIYIGDSQTMTAEAAVLGTPALRFNDFVGRIGYLEELEHDYGLTFGFRSDQTDALLEKIGEFLAMADIKAEWQRRRRRMLGEKIDVADFIIRLLENFPESVNTILRPENGGNKKYLFYFGHPAQYLFFKPIIRKLREDKHGVILVAKTKDVLTNLLEYDHEHFINILPEGRKPTQFFILFALLKRDFRLLRMALRSKPDLFIGSDPSLAHVAFLLRKPSLTTLEDDYEVIKKLADITYPFSSCIVTPAVCQVGKWEAKKIGYRGYMKLSYLHPSIFSPNREKVSIASPYVLLRLASLKAHHDFGVSGLNFKLIKRLIELINARGRTVVISSEAKITDPAINRYTIRIRPNDIHHFLFYADLFISDSQSMSVEAAMLGTPSIRFSDFAGKISVLEELEHIYHLTFGVPTSRQDLLLTRTADLLAQKDLKKEFTERKNAMLKDKINVSQFFTWFIENWPESRRVMKENPDYQLRFK